MPIFVEGNVITDVEGKYHYTLKKRIGTGSSGYVWSVEIDDVDNPRAVVKFFVREPDMTDEDWFAVTSSEYLFAKWSDEYSKSKNLSNPCESGSICAIRMFEVKIERVTIAGLVFANKGAIDLNTYYKMTLHPAFERGDRDFANRQALKIAIGILERIAVVHRLGAIHMDIKPQNVVVVVDSYDQIRNVFLIDFGIWCTPNGKQFMKAHNIPTSIIECRQESSKYYYETTQVFADPESGIFEHTRVLFDEPEHLAAFKKFDLFASAVTIWYAWAPEAYELIGLSPVAIDPVIKTKYMSEFIGYELPAGVGRLSDLDRAIFDDRGPLCFLFSKMSGPLNKRWSASQLISIFTELIRFNESH